MPKEMKEKYKTSHDITKQLDDQGVSYVFLTGKELDDITGKWKDRFIAKRTAPYLDNHWWHIFSYNKDNRLEGDDAKNAYRKQYPTDILIFNERLQYGLKCSKSDKLPNIEMDDF